MILSLLLFAAGLALLVGGAWLLVGGGVRIAAVLRVPAVVVGLTVVAFGTSAPELFVSLAGALRGSTGLVLGNVIGSNVANLGLILAGAALLRPVRVERGLVRRELPLLLAVTLLFMALTWDGRLARAEAGLLCLVFAGFMVWTIRGAGRNAPALVPRPRSGDLPAVAPDGRARGLALGGVLVLLGVAGLAAGGQLIVDSALVIARRVGASETLIGLTLVAVGTSLPELATTLMAAWKDEDDLALGNIVGSNLFNILAVAGPVGLVRELTDDPGFLHVQLLCMLALTLLVVVKTRLGGGDVGRGRGALLLLAYVLVMVIWTTRS